MALTHALTPIKINRVEIKNRIFRSGHSTHLGRGSVNDALIAYHEARAAGGVGLITLDINTVHPSSGSHSAIHAWDDAVIPGYKALAKAIHKHGAKVFAQAWHGGMHWRGVGNTLPWSCSDVPSPWGAVPIEMSEEQIEMLVAAFAATAARMREGGLDGVEMHFGHSYLVHQFLAPITNRRTDKYGGSLENRMRFGREILRAARKLVGDDFAVGIRLSDSHVPEGLSVEDCVEVVRSLCQEGLIDFINGSMGSYWDIPAMVPAMDAPVGCMLPSSGPIVGAATSKTSGGRPVVRKVAGRFQTLEDADQLIRNDVADMVAIVRAMIADPELVNKYVSGRADEVRPCIGCNQGCVGAQPYFTGGHIGCTVNPAVGEELSLSESLIVPSQRALKVVVVGGGPAGMEAARLAALSGHSVVLFEAASKLGGALNHARRAPNLRAIGDIALWQEREILRLGVDLRLSTFAEREEILAEEPDAVILATGSTPRLDGWSAAVPGLPTKGVARRNVYSSHEIFDVPKEQLGASAVVFDDVGHYEACGVAEYLIAQGLSVTFVTRHSMFAPQMEPTQRNPNTLSRLRKGDFNLIVRGRLIEVDEGTCRYGYLEGEQTFLVPAETIVLISNNQPLTEVHKAMLSGNAAPSFSCELIGDALSPRNLQIAIAEGHRAGRSISVTRASA